MARVGRPTAALDFGWPVLCHGPRLRGGQLAKLAERQFAARA